MKKALLTTLIVFALVVSLVAEVQVVGASSKTITVPDDYQSIQAAIDNALDGDRVVVKSGTYNGSVLIDKAISLVGENSPGIIGDYRLNGTVILVTSDNVNITGFTVEPSAPSPSRRGVHLLDANHCNIYNNKFINNKIGIWLYGSSENTITGNSVFGSGDIFGEIDSYGAQLLGSNRNSIENNIFENNHYGIYIYSSSHNNVTNNRVKNNFSTGIMINANENQLIDNVIEGNTVGLSLHGSNNILKNNQLSNNTANFKIEWNYYEDTSTFFNDVDASNTIEGNPIIYWVDVQNEKVPDNAAFVCLVRCVNVTVENLRLQGNDAGVVLVATTNSSVKNNLVAADNDGVLVCESSGNVISQNRITGCDCGIRLAMSNKNSLSYNTMSDCSTGLVLKASAENLVKANTISGDVAEGVTLQDSHKNNITENAIVDCKRVALMFWLNSSGNLFYLNNFINNTKNVEEMYSERDIDHHVNSWNNGTVGNYWSDYTGADSNNDGIGDTPYIIDANNKDNYPLIAPNNNSIASPSPSSSHTPSSSPTPSPSPTQQPTLEPTKSAQPTAPQHSQPLPFLPIIIVAFVIVAITIVGLAVYFTKYRKKKN
jgi:parallel beta-helix repeat protein